MSVPGRRPTIIDVAERAGVSRQTVSRALNDMSGISASTREAVLAAVEELNYRPSRFGRGLVEQGPITLGLVVMDLSNSYFAELGAAVVRACAPYGWNVVLAEADNAPRPDRVTEELARRVDALVGYDVLTGGIRGGAGMPVVQLGDLPSSGEKIGIVELSTSTAIADLTAHLRAVGVTRPAVVDLVGAVPSSRARALTAALAPLTADGEVPIQQVDVHEGHRAALESVLATGADALVAFNDELAVRLLRMLRALDVAVPEQVRLVGVDGLEIGSLVTPELTTLSIDIEEVARQTVEMVAGMLDGSVPLTGPSAHRVVHYELEVRAST
ncbi:transcriptional regulator [Brachybacterium sp. P6-10-X1]|uniref:LacI family DNA-binding transcriptional regulator n=1 Tax=Brachybacterium sp. P6-10-X1 TaxID=1903186 RepID=UPI000971AD96|nr:LacI family DNA-binding transcriptional regulator [Brachybacterium sp. P6-10-X1]APX32292.1 transcriptional regulator [Brachybacterium sp. P6-10-X1]